MLDAHGKMEPIEHKLAVSPSEITWSLGAVAQDCDRRFHRGAQAPKNVGQLLALTVSLCWYAAEYDLVASVVARLSDKNLE